MDTKVIEQSVSELPVIELEKVAERDEAWEVTDGGAHVIVSRRRITLPDQDPVEALALSVTGPSSERMRVIFEFMTSFGEPAEEVLAPDDPYHMDIVMWLMRADSC